MYMCVYIYIYTHSYIYLYRTDIQYGCFSPFLGDRMSKSLPAAYYTIRLIPVSVNKDSSGEEGPWEDTLGEHHTETQQRSI